MEQNEPTAAVQTASQPLYTPAGRDIIHDLPEAVHRYFAPGLIRDAKCAADKDKATKKRLKSQIRATYRASKPVLKEDVAREADARKAIYDADRAALEAELKKTLDAAEDRYLALPAEERMKPAVQKEHKDIISGERTKCQRAVLKLTRDYEADLNDIKLQKAMLTEAETGLLRAVTGAKFTPFANMRVSWKSRMATFSLKKTFTDKRTWLNLLPFIMLIVIICAHAIACAVTGYKFNLGTIITYGIYVAVVAIGGVFIYSQGAFDMSLGPAAMMCAAVAGISYISTGNIFVSFLCAVLLGVCLGLINAFLANVLKLPVMVMTLTMMNILSSVFATISENQSLGYVLVPGIKDLNGYGVKWAVLIIFAVLCFILFNYTKIGRKNKLIGSNPVCAKFTGISLMKAGLISFAISGIGLGLCGLLFIMENGYIDTNAAINTVGLNVIIAISIGGMPTSGGPRSRISAAIVGAFFLIFLEQFFAALSLDNVQYLAKGIIFLAVAFVNFYGSRPKRLAQ